jgi:hypothetical protein
MKYTLRNAGFITIRPLKINTRNLTDLMEKQNYKIKEIYTSKIEYEL